ncbi:MAG: HI1506-related protein [Bacillota bacterium]
MAIKIISKRAGFRRCGIEHPDKPVVYPADKFSKEQLAQLKAEPMLIVEEVPDEPAKEEKKKGGSSGGGSKGGAQQDAPQGTGPDPNQGGGAANE